MDSTAVGAASISLTPRLEGLESVVFADGFANTPGGIGPGGGIDFDDGHAFPAFRGGGGGASVERESGGPAPRASGGMPLKRGLEAKDFLAE